MKQLIQPVINHLQKKQDLVIATVISHKGSTPRGAGAKMVIYEDGKSMGSIGGGLVEAEVITAASHVYKNKKPILYNFDMTHETLTPGNMICGGKMEILVDYIGANKENITIYAAIDQAFQNREKSMFVTFLQETEVEQTLITHSSLFNADGSLHKSASGVSLLPDTLKSQLKDITQPSLLTVDKNRFLMEPLLLPPKLYLFGAGHVSRPTATLGMSVGFQTIVIDDRESCVSREFFAEPAEIKLISDFKDCFQDLQIDSDSYLVIVTRGHICDKIVLEQALKSEAAYVGMIGSRKKRNTIYRNLLEEGFSEKDLDRVHSPIGLDIGAETPEELAVSIISELIQVRAGRKA